MSSLSSSFPRLILGGLLLLLPSFGYAQEKPPALPELMVEPVVALASNEEQKVFRSLGRSES